MKQIQEFLKSLGQNYTIDELANLTTLYLHSNSLASLPDLSKLTNLTSLNLSNNKLTSLPDLSKLTNLQYLNLSNNPLIIFESQLEWLNKIPYHTDLSEFKIIKDNELTRSLFL